MAPSGPGTSLLVTGVPVGRHGEMAYHHWPGLNALLIASRWPLSRVRLRAAPILDPGRWLVAKAGTPSELTIGALHVPNRVTGRKFPFLDAVLGLAHNWWHGPAGFMARLQVDVSRLFRHARRLRTLPLA